MSTDQYTFTDPRTLYPAISPPIQQQEEPGIQARMEPIPDLGEHTVELVDYRAAEHSSPAVIRESVALWRSPSPARGRCGHQLPAGGGGRLAAATAAMLPQ